jgi:hypothetical protein
MINYHLVVLLDAEIDSRNRDDGEGHGGTRLLGILRFVALRNLCPEVQGV